MAVIRGVRRSTERGARIDCRLRTALAPHSHRTRTTLALPSHRTRTSFAPHPHPHRSLTPPQPRQAGGERKSLAARRASLALGFAPSGRSPGRADRQRSFIYCFVIRSVGYISDRSSSRSFAASTVLITPPSQNRPPTGDFNGSTDTDSGRVPVIPRTDRTRPRRAAGRRASPPPRSGCSSIARP
ncbi:hypothetical protein SAMN06264855_101101 [Halorubrum vacuolatum]|uniref:Uncharacterized protein n=1 Tax=Halorubrum vacuolatum TaxID=63740 RepID=A0A238UMP2_HALVU|nr:hypothetical protein SAMN06264855_101101 [Halorubrum vacuolatum]